MKAMIFAAGLGTRLKPITDNIPKALVEVQGIPLLEIAIKKLLASGCKDIIVNIHHYGNQIVEFLEEKHYFHANIEVSDETEMLLETGGGLWKARDFLDGWEPFLVCNVDVVSNIDLGEMLRWHKEQQALATLAVSHRNTSRYFLFDEDMRLSGWENTKEGKRLIVRSPEKPLQHFAFSGIHIIEPDIFPMINEKGRFSITDVYLKLAAEQKILGYDHTGRFWMDLGKPADLATAASIDMNDVMKA
ncbi:MAG: nucleotidyltransferase family protein [Bacteroidetes bacterium]|nr:nucleotidyltransferase family protein [Bacteroidota bacterium]MBU1720169.1 nucleotidyltransferase family protein [Bacteroidota bacterium]